MIRTLHSKDASVHRPTSGAGNTPLMLAAKGGHVEAVKVLLELRAGVEAKNGEGWTALHFAAKEGRMKVCRVLVEGGAVKGEENARGETAGDLACAWGHWKCVEFCNEGL